MARQDRWGGGGGVPETGASGKLGTAGAVLGFALGGFFDGILFHQILQWHHLLSGLDGPSWRSLRVQVMADGLFHALMYVIALVGLCLLWRARHTQLQAGGRRFLGAALAGFGLWHVVDGILFHWLLGLHHIRMDTQSVLLWDMAVLALGLIALAAGLALWRGGGSTGSGPGVSTGGRSAGRTAFLFSLVVVLAGAWALRPGPDGLVTAVFPAGAPPGAALQAIAAADGRLVWLDAQGGVAVLALPKGARGGWTLYRAGALFVRGTLSPPGCFASSRPPAVV